MKPVIELQVARIETRCFIDTGSTCTLIKYEFANTLLSAGEFKTRPCSLELSSITSSDINTHGIITLPFLFGKRNYLHQVIICSNASFPGAVLIGTDLLKRLNKVTFDFNAGVMTILDKGYNILDSHLNSEVAMITSNHQKLRNCLSASHWKGDENVEEINEEPESSPPSLTHLQKLQQDNITELLARFSSAVSQDDTDLGYCDLVKHKIDTGRHRPICTRQWPIPNSTKQTMEEQCKKMLEMGVIEPCASPWRSPSLLIKKSDGTYRYCIDFRNINNVTTKDNFPIPRIDTVLESLKGATVFSSLDLKSGYWQIPIAEEDRDKTAFSTSSATYRFRRMAFGLCNAPASFQRLMQNILEPVLNKCAMVYLDDIIIY